MANYKEAQGVADLLSQFDFNIISEGPGDFSTQHRKYTCEFSKPGIESFTTTYRAASEALVAHGASAVDLEHEADNARTAASPLSKPDSDR